MQVSSSFPFLQVSFHKARKPRSPSLVTDPSSFIEWGFLSLAKAKLCRNFIRILYLLKSFYLSYFHLVFNHFQHLSFTSESFVSHKLSSFTFILNLLSQVFTLSIIAHLFHSCLIRSVTKTNQQSFLYSHYKLNEPNRKESIQPSLGHHDPWFVFISNTYGYS